MNKVLYSRGKFIKSVGEEYQAVKEYHSCGEEKNEKKGKGELISSSLNYLGCYQEGKGDMNFGEEDQDIKNGDEEEYQVVGNFIHPCCRSRRRSGLLTSRLGCSVWHSSRETLVAGLRKCFHHSR